MPSEVIINRRNYIGGDLCTDTELQLHIQEQKSFGQP